MTVQSPDLLFKKSQTPKQSPQKQNKIPKQKKLFKIILKRNKNVLKLKK